MMLCAPIPRPWPAARSAVRGHGHCCSVDAIADMELDLFDGIDRHCILAQIARQPLRQEQALLPVRHA